MSKEIMKILFAEDDEGHATLVQRNLQRAGIANEIIHVKDGQEALDYLKNERVNGGENHQIPMLMLLDINMPRLNGIDVLRAVKRDPSTAALPVIMLTTTDDPREVQRCYQLGCSVYLTKPMQYGAFVDAIKRLGLFLEIMVAPPMAIKADVNGKQLEHAEHN